MLANTQKRPTSKGWQKKSASLDAVLRHAGAGKPVAVIPASVGCVVLDVDDGGDAGAEEVKSLLAPAQPLAEVPTRRAGGWHLWYADRDACGVRNRQWSLGGTHGDVRGGKGYVILWDPSAVAAGLANPEPRHCSPDLARLPRPWNASAGGPAAVAAAPDGARNNTLFREATRAAKRGGLDREAFKRAALATGLPRNEVETTLDNAARAGANSRSLVFKRKDAAALEQALAMLGTEVRYDVRAQRAEFRDKPEIPWTSLTDRSTGHLRRVIAENFSYQTSRGSAPLHYGGETWQLWMNALLHDREVDPFVLWLEALPPWDGIERSFAWLDDLFQIAGEHALATWTARFLLLGPVWRAFEPGTKLDEMPVLIGDQGIGKSTALRLLLPPEYPEWFADGLHLAASPKERAEALQGRVIVEVAEMAGSTRADLESLKTFLSRTDDGTVRLSYRRDPELLLRRCIIAGTTNLDEPLPNDPSGNRRFVPVRLKGGNAREVRAYLDRHRNQMWAEAVALYREGVPAWLPPELAKVQAEATVEFARKDDLLEDAITCWLRERTEQNRRAEPFTMEEIVGGCQLIGTDDVAAKLPVPLMRRVAAVLTKHDFVKKRERREGRRFWVWAPR